MKKLEYVQALRELADFVESKDFPDVVNHRYGVSDFFTIPRLTVWLEDKITFGKLASVLGSFGKERGSYSTGMTKILPLGASIEISASRETVCRKIVVGTKTVAAKEEEIIPAEPEHEEDIVSWECPESFIALAETNSEEK